MNCVCVCVCTGVGKTSLVVRNMGGVFSENVSPTIGASFFSLQMYVSHFVSLFINELLQIFRRIIAGYRIKLQVWDTAGQERSIIFIIIMMIIKNLFSIS